MKNIYIKPINNYMIPNLQTEEFYINGVMVDKVSDCLAIKVNPLENYYSFIMSGYNKDFVISKDNKEVFLVFKEFFKDIIKRYCLEMDEFSKRMLPKDFISKDKYGNTIIKFETENLGKDDTIYFAYTSKGIVVRTVHNSKDIYNGIDIKVYETNYDKFYLDIHNLIGNLLSLINMSKTKQGERNERFNNREFISVYGNENTVNVYKEGKTLMMEKEEDGMVLSLYSKDKNDYSFTLEDKVLNPKEKELYTYFVKMFTDLFAEAILNRKAYPKDFVNLRDKVMTIRNLTGDVLTIKYDHHNIVINITMAKRDQEIADLLFKYYGEDITNLDRKITIPLKDDTYPLLGKEVYELFKRIRGMFGNNLNTGDTLERRR